MELEDCHMRRPSNNEAGFHAVRAVAGMPLQLVCGLCVS
jgi:hypothetical protein